MGQQNSQAGGPASYSPPMGQPTNVLQTGPQTGPMTMQGPAFAGTTPGASGGKGGAAGAGGQARALQAAPAWQNTVGQMAQANRAPSIDQLVGAVSRGIGAQPGTPFGGTAPTGRK